MRLGKLRWSRMGYGLGLVLRVGLGCMFLWSALPKIRQPYDFLGNVYEYELAGPKLGMMTAMVLPWLELLLGVCLIGGIFVGGALLISVLLAGIFVYAHASTLYHGLAISCGCFSTSSTELISYATLIRAISILLACLTAAICLFMLSPYPNPVIPAQAGIQKLKTTILTGKMDSRFRGNDTEGN